MKSLLSLFLVAPIFAYASDWQYVTHGSDMILNIDRSSISILKDGKRKAWKEYAFTEAQTIIGDTKQYKRIMLLSVFNCTARTSSVIQEVYYDDVDRGKVVRSMTYPIDKVEYSDVVPESFDEAALNVVCNYKFKTK
jgi:hypothetical protein